MLLAVSFLAASLVFGATAPTPTATPTVPPTATPTLTPSASPTATLTPTLEPSPTSTASPTIGLPPTPTAAPTHPAVIQPAAGTPASQLPPTMPGLSRDEGTFLITAADDGSRAVYFIAGNARHSILQADLQLETQLNPLWPVRQASRDEVLAIVEGSPVGSAPAGLLSGPATASDAVAETAAIDQPIAQPPTSQPVAQPAVDQPAIARPVVDQPVAAQPASEQPVAPQPVAGQPAAAQPVAAQPVASQPVADQPAAAKPAVEQPVAAEPTVQLPVGAQSSSDTPAGQATYILQPGDNLTRLAERYGTSVQAILAANHLTNANIIYVGKSLVIPTASAQATPVEVAAPLADRSQEEAPPVADIPQEAAAPVADVPLEAPTTYTVRAGDSAIGIARQFGVDLDALVAANNVADRNRVLVGQVLTIPSSES